MKQANGSRYKYYSKWDKVISESYDYENKGLLKHLMSRRITTVMEEEQGNTTLKIILNFFEDSIEFLLRYVDRLKHFKDVHWKNR